MLPVISIIIDRLKPRTKEFRTVYEFMITVARYEEAGFWPGKRCFFMIEEPLQDCPNGAHYVVYIK
jgi:hypothetical protein